jgi:hypothetical protein
MRYGDTTGPAPPFALEYRKPEGMLGWPEGPAAELDAWPHGKAAGLWLAICEADECARIHLEGAIASFGLGNVAYELARILGPDDLAGFRPGWNAAGGRPSFGGQITKALREAIRVYQPRLPTLRQAKSVIVDPALDAQLALISRK